jgi:dihydroflavonol-4-reductase
MIYITGATGHIGNNLVRKLHEQTIDFRILSRSIQRSISDFEDKVIIGDVFSIDFLKAHLLPQDTLVHLAAYINLRNDKQDLTEEINYLGVKRIADFCASRNIFLVYTSSTDAITSDNYLISEPEEINPENLVSYYQKSKAKATNYILNLTKNKELSSFIIYPSAVIGINDFKPSALGKELKRTFRRRVCFYFHGGYNFIDVEDVALSIITGLKEKKSGSYIISGEQISLYDMYKLIFNTLNKKVLMIKIPVYLIKLAGKILPKFNVMIKALLTKHNYNNQRMIEELKITPTPITKTITKTVNWFKEDMKK